MNNNNITDGIPNDDKATFSGKYCKYIYLSNVVQF